MPHKIFYQDGTTKVTDECVIFGSTWKICLNDIVAVFVTKQASYRRYVIFPGVVCLLIGIGVPLMLCFSVIFFLCAVIMRPRYILRIKTGTGIGEIRPLNSYNKSELNDIKDAIYRAKSYDEEYTLDE